MAIFTAIATAIATSLGMALATTATATFITVTAAIMQGLTMALVSFGGVMLSKTLAKKDYGSMSSTYGNPTLQTQTNPDLPVALLYGTVKLAGNRIWQDDNTKKGIKRIVAFCEGEITDITDIRLNDTPTNKIKGIKVNKYFGTSYQGLPSGLTSEKVGSLKDIAYLYINVPKSEKIDINYNLTAVVKGKKIRVYSNPTTYTVQYSENPAWILFDFLTCYNGRGLCLNDNGTLNDTKVAQMFDLNSFIEAAAFCDETVTTNGVTSPRFTFNMIFDAQTSHRTLMDEIYRNCRGVLAVKNGKLQFKIDKAEATKKVFYDKDIVDGSETFQTIPHEEHYDILKIDYISPDHEWQKVQAFAELPEYRDGVPIEHQVSCYSITNFQQASRLAWYYINSKRLCPYFGSFQTGFKGADLEVGDVISIPVILMGLENYLVKVTSVIDNSTGIYTVNYRTYNANLYGDTLGSQEPTVLVTNLGDLYDTPKDVENFNVTQDDNYYSFTWNYNNETDTYEIRYGESWDSGEVIGKQIYVNNYIYPIKTRGRKTFWIKARNDYNQSENATMDVIYIGDIPDSNVIVNYKIFRQAEGIFTNTYVYHSKLKLSVDNVLWETTTDKWNEGNQYYQNGGIWGADTYTEGSYVSQIYDLSEVVLSYVSPEFDYISSDTEAEVKFEWRYSEDNITWTDWGNINAGQYAFRYSQYRVTINSPNGSQVTCTKFNVSIDVPDKFIVKELEVTDANSGGVVYYDFLTVPSIVATVNDNITAYAVVTSKTNKQATVMVYNNSGNTTTGNVSLYMKGY